MKLYELGRYNIPEKIIDAWIGQIGEELLPVQERAIKRYRVLEGNSLIISSPTSSGKTFMIRRGSPINESQNPYYHWCAQGDSNTRPTDS